MATERKQTIPEEDKAVARKAGEERTDGDGGRTAIDDSVVSKVAAVAAREVPGVWDLGEAPARAVGAAIQRAGIAGPRRAGVAAEVGERQAALDLTIVVEYGESIPRVSQEVRENVIRRVEGICGLEVTEVNIDVNDLHFPGEEPAEARVE